ncbi:pyridoxal phosphate-dependent aminotransferase [Glycomyces sp. YM15]|uniref:pyridoxal phosphate-dependent aminotransferase n=1 Tax=Glycomyces sp. YM15 TaxID=2800446 RepID=UPI001962A9DD
MSATLAADEALERRRRGGERVLSLASGEIGLPVPPLLETALAAAVGRTAYGPVAGDPALRDAAAGYWHRRGVPADPDLVVCGPGSKPLLFAAMLAIGGDVVVPVPSWVSYVQQARLAGAEAVGVPIIPGQGGVPDPERLAEAVARARASGRDPRSVVVTVPDNPTGTVATPATMRRLTEAARDLDLVVIADEIYRDLVFDPALRPPSPADSAPERTIVTTGLTKHLALGGWRLGVARLPDERLRERFTAIASQIWSTTAAPVQAAAALALREPPIIGAHVAAAVRLHGTTARAVAERIATTGAALAPVTATCYLYPDFSPLRDRLRRKGIENGQGIADFLAERHGVAVLPGEAFGEPGSSLRIRTATGRLYGATHAERAAALDSDDPLQLPWIARSLDHLERALADLTR